MYQHLMASNFLMAGFKSAAFRSSKGDWCILDGFHTLRGNLSDAYSVSAVELKIVQIKMGCLKEKSKSFHVTMELKNTEYEKYLYFSADEQHSP